MKIKNQRLYYKQGVVGKEIYMFTANSTLTQSGKAVMGAGCARVVRDTYANIDKLFGKIIDDQEVFGVKFIQHGYQWIGAFQTKTHWQKPSPLEVVEESVRQLTWYAERRPDWIFHLPCPAINHGKRSLQEVLPLLESLPDNVFVYVDK